MLQIWPTWCNCCVLCRWNIFNQGEWKKGLFPVCHPGKEGSFCAGHPGSGGLVHLRPSRFASQVDSALVTSTPKLCTHCRTLLSYFTWVWQVNNNNKRVSMFSFYTQSWQLVRGARIAILPSHRAVCTVWPGWIEIPAPRTECQRTTWWGVAKFIFTGSGK